MKGKFLHIGAVVLGFIVTVQGAAALGLPHLHDARLAQIDAEEISQGEESRIRFSDTERVLPAIKASPSQQSMSSSLAAAEELSLEEQMVQRMNEQRREQRRERNDRMQRNQNQYQDDQGNQNQNNQNRQDQNRNQNNQRNQNQDRQNNPNNQNNQNQNGWDNGTICPDTDDERCFYPDSQRERCELFGGTYSNGRCSLEDSQWYRDREERRECEDRGGNYINGQCEMNNGTNRRYDDTRRYEDDGGNTDRIQCEDQGGVYRNGRCQMNTSHMNDRSNTSNERQRCEDRGGQYSQGTCSIDYGDDQNHQNNQNQNNRNNRSSSIGEDEDVLVGSTFMVRTEKRKTCEKEGGEYLGNGRCVIPYYDQQKCDEKDGTYYQGECIMDTDDL